ncbi:hypothetical protein FIBSPDRAFT_1054992 [Athelia psychrophila]|uniref:Uncharacterized protein n=1 Tax=Athelia psychrophila TaxID=1759441 RepID=A0A167UHE4_9AGAM|nr:hypothetical protein FIBSPDRAFT_1054992 [Fibularhizoctonia sp. CBS 109695]
MLCRLSLVVCWSLWMLVSSAAPIGGVRREWEVEPLPVEDFARELGDRGCGGGCDRGLSAESLPVEGELGERGWAKMIVEPLSVEDFVRELAERDCWGNGRACNRELEVEPLPVEGELGDRGWAEMIAPEGSP